MPALTRAEPAFAHTHPHTPRSAPALQEKGITARGNLSRFARRSDGAAEPNTWDLSAENAGELAKQLNAQGETSAAAAVTAAAAAVASEAGPSSASGSGSGSKRKLSASPVKAEPAGESSRSVTPGDAAAKISAAARARAAAAARRRGNFDEEEDDEEEEPEEVEDDEDEDDNDASGTYGGASTRASSSATPAAAAASKGKAAIIKIDPPAALKKPPGALAYCAACKKRFTVTQYSAYIAKGAICHDCGKDAVAFSGAKAEGGIGAAASSSSAVYTGSAAANGAAKKRAAPRRKLDSQKRELTTLQQVCINVISKNIEMIKKLSHLARGGWTWSAR